MGRRTPRSPGDGSTDEVALGILVAVIINGLFDATAVAYLAGRRSKKALVTYLESKESNPLWDKQAAKVLDVIGPNVDTRLGRFEGVLRSELLAPTETKLDALKAETTDRLDAFDAKMEAFANDVFGKLDTLPTSIQAQVVGETGRKMQEAYAEIEKAGKGLEGAAAAMAPASNVFQAQMARFIQAPIPKKMERENPFGAFILGLAKSEAAKRLYGAGLVTEQFGGEAGGFAASWK